MTSPTVEIPVEYKRLFDSDWREAAVYGGRYSLKSHTVARILLTRARQKQMRIGCFREFQNSINDSSHQLLSDLIELYNLTDFKITDNSIINTINGSDFLFRGLHHNEQSIKSIEGIDIAWCLVAGTKINGRNIEDILPGEYVLSYNHNTNFLEHRKVLRVTKRHRKENLYKLSTQYGLSSIILTGEHPVYIKGRGYVSAKDIKKGEVILYEETKLTRENSLFGRLWRTNTNRHGRETSQVPKKWWNILLGLRESKSIKAHEATEPNGQSRNQREDEESPQADETQTKRFGGQWSRLYTSSRTAIQNAWARLVERISSYYSSAKRQRLPNQLQTGLGEHILHVSDRVRWFGTRRREKPTRGRKENSTITELRVDSIEVQEQGDIEQLGLSDGGNYVYNIEVEVNNNYFANGILTHNCEEAQTISQKSLEVLTPTVRKEGSQLIYTYNRLLEDDPVHVRLVKEGRPNTLVINTNYDIAEKYGWLPSGIKDEIESDRINRPALYKHKWLGEPNSLERRVYQDWVQVDQVPHEARLERRGLDFGYKNDPSAIIAIYYYNGGYILDEELYRKGMKNNELATFLNTVDNPNTLVIGDSAEPKSIAELQESGVNILGVKKAGGKDSLGNKKNFKQYGIDYVRQQKISVTKRSQNIWREYKGYLHQEDNSGKILNDPEDGNDHSMDALMYGFMGLKPQKKHEPIKQYQPTNFMAGF